MKTLLDADYTTREEQTVIRLYYKENGKRTIEEVTGFEPYFYAIPGEGETDDLKKDAEKIGNVVRVEKTAKKHLSGDIDVLKVTVRQPRDVPELRRAVKELSSCKGVREAAIPFVERYLIDAGLTPMEDADKADLRIASFDMEVYNPRGQPDAAEDPIIMISYADNAGDEIVWSYRNHTDLPYVRLVKDEKEMIKAFVDHIIERGIDLIVTYNGDNFDFPYLKDRAAKCRVKTPLGIDESGIKTERRGMNMGARIRGRPHVDLYPVSRQLFNITRYTLEDVYLELYGEEKEDIEVENMAKVWDSGDAVKLEELYSYSLSDAKSTLRIALSMLPLQYELARITGKPIYECSREGSGQRVEDLLIKTAFKKNILVPNRPSDRIVKERLANPYAGAYVVEPERGIHDDIALFDFRSLYPSILVSHNIDPATVDCKCCPGETEHYPSPTGHYFCRKTRGFIPETLDGLVAKRIDIKKKLKKEEDPAKKRMLDVEQQALKILANSVYGYLGYPRARWYSREGAEAIAALGREYIKDTKKKAEDAGFRVVYGDTDSIYMTKEGEKDKKKLLTDAKAFMKEINAHLPEGMELEFEGFYPRGIFITKKRYAVIDDKGTLTIKGLETRRRDWSKITKDTQMKVLRAILEDRDPEKAAAIVKETVKRIQERKVPLEELAINTQITRGLGEYVTEGPHIHAVKKAMKRGLEFKQGNIVTYVITRKGSSISDKAQLLQFVEEGDYDADYYVSNQVIPAVQRILEALGYSEDELKGKGKQMSLGDW